MAIVIEGGQPGDLGEAVDVEGDAELGQAGDDLLGGDPVSEAGSGQAVDLGERAEDQDIFPFPKIFEGIGISGDHRCIRCRPRP